jgi:hypothetical protein
MNVKSKFDTEEEYVEPRSQYMRGGCGAPYSMINGPTRMDVSSVRAPRFIERIFRLMGWKTEADKRSDN